ncbi:hypothetical protein GJAV_G00089010 [Gymnothorax javanicus]|nr:hypothetical protein GJAV_G00089010 [Gymnothorax javanicus]
MAYFKDNFWGEKNTGFHVLYHNMKHGHLCTKELAEFVRERAAIEEAYSKSLSKLAKMASSGSPLGTFAPMWDVFRVSSDKLALCHLELTKKMSDLIRDINKYGEEQVKVHRKTKEEQMGTGEAVQALQTQSGLLQKSREGYHGKCAELERLQREGAPQKEVEKDFEQKMSQSAQRFQDLEETHLRQMKLLIKAFSHSIEDTHVQVGQVHEEFKQNVQNIAIETLLQKFAEQKGTGRDRPAPVGFEGLSTALVPDVGKRSRGKAFRLPGLGRRDKEPGSTESAAMEPPTSAEVDEEGFVIRAEVTENDIFDCDSDFDDDEPKKFRIQIRPADSDGRANSAANELELRATESVKRNLSRNSNGIAVVRSEGEGDGASHRSARAVRGQGGARGSTSSPERSRLSSTVSAGSEALFGPPLEMAFDLCASTDPAFSSDSSSPENVEDSGLDSPSHQPLGPSLGPSPEPVGWVAWPVAAPQSKSSGRPPDPSRARTRRSDPACPWAPPSDPGFGVPSFGQGLDPAVWTCRHIPHGDPFLAAFERTALSEAPPPPGPWAPPCRSRGREAHPSSLSSSSSSAPPSDRDPGALALESPEDPFSITIIGSPTHQAAQSGGSSRSVPTPGSAHQPRKELAFRGSERNPFSPAGGAPEVRDGGGANEEPRPDGVPITLSLDLQEELGGESSDSAGTQDRVTPLRSQSCSSELLDPAGPRLHRAAPNSGAQNGTERPWSVCSSPYPDSGPGFTASSSSSSSPSEWAGLSTPTPRSSSPARGLSRGPSPLSLSVQEAWPVAAALTEYVNAYFKGGEGNRCLVKITGDLTVSFPAGITRIFTATPNTPVLSFRLVNTARVDQFLPNQKLLFSDPSQNDPKSRDFWFNMNALTCHLQKETQLNPKASYYNVSVLKYQLSSEDPSCAPVLLSAECLRSGTVSRISLDYRWNPALPAMGAELSSMQVLLPLDRSATDPQCQPPASWNSEEGRLLWKLPNLSPTGKGKGALCASWQCSGAPRGPPPSLALAVDGLRGGSVRPGGGAGGRALSHVAGEEEVRHRKVHGQLFVVRNLGASLECSGSTRVAL